MARKFLPSSDIIIERLLYNKNGQICVSVLLGLGLASVFRRVCNDNQCRVLRAAPMENIKNKVFKVGDRCVKYIPYPIDCTAQGGAPEDVTEQLVIPS